MFTRIELIALAIAPCGVLLLGSAAGITALAKEKPDRGCYYTMTKRDMTNFDKNECYYAPKGPRGCLPRACKPQRDR